MIARDSKSYPYLAIAQHYRVPYAEVLKYAEFVKGILHYSTILNIPQWKHEVWKLERYKALLQCNIK